MKLIRLLLAAGLALLSGCALYAASGTGWSGVVIQYKLAPGAANKHGLQGISDTGRAVFTSSTLNPKNGGVLMYDAGNLPLPRRVQVTWREGDVDKDFKTGRWISGTIVGDYTVEVLSRIPQTVFTYVKQHRGTSIRLLFTIKDDGVLLSWDVQERVRHPRGGSALVNSLHGGDLPCPEIRPDMSPTCTDLPLERAPWYLPEWIRG